MSHAFLLSILWLAAVGPAETKPRVFVQADPRIAEKDPAKGRELSDSVTDLREQIEKRHELAAAKNRSDAEILITLLDRRIEVNRAGETKYFGYTQTHYQSRYVLAFRVEASWIDLESETALAGAFVTWKRVAGVLAKDVEGWARAHREKASP
jgi:hypothetical protein